MLLRHKVAYGLLLAIAAGDLAAQQRPGGNGPLPGDPGYGNGASQSQLPPPPPRPRGQWIKTWGAVANGSNGEGGVSVGMLTKAAAEDEAIAQCVRGGGQSCRPSFTYYNQCVAILQAVSNSVTDTIQSAESVEVAARLGRPKCSNDNKGAECHVVYSACSDPIFRSF